MLVDVVSMHQDKCETMEKNMRDASTAEVVKTNSQ
jgi:hypothetical protein